MKKGFFAADFISYENIPDTIIRFAAGTRIGVRSFVSETIAGSGVAVAVRRFGTVGFYGQLFAGNRRREEVFGRNGKSKVCAATTPAISTIMSVKAIIHLTASDFLC